MLALALLTVAARADVAIRTCGLGNVIATAPEDGQEDVPLDGHLVVVFSAGCGGSDFELQVLPVVDDVAGAPVDDETLSLTFGQTTFVEFFPPDLAPNTEYEAHAGPPGNLPVIWRFHTGDRRAVGIADAPTATTTARYEAHVVRPRRDLMALQVDPHPADDPDGTSILQITDANADFAGIELASAPFEVPFQFDLEEHPSPTRFCADITQIDALGAQTTTQACDEDVDHRLACDHADSTASLFGLGVVGGALARRVVRR